MLVRITTPQQHDSALNRRWVEECPLCARERTHGLSYRTSAKCQKQTYTNQAGQKKAISGVPTASTINDSGSPSRQ
jgi:hypothetical protein